MSDRCYFRTLPDMMKLKVAYNDIIYMIQNYAEVSGNSHLSGSINGGLSISINGNNFGDDDDEVKVMIAGMYVKIIYTNDEGFLFCCLTYFATIWCHL